MTITEVTLRDLLLPGIAGLEGKFGDRVEGDLKVDPDGDLWLLLAARGRSAKIHMASPGYIKSGGYKDTFGIKAQTAFDAFDQATKDRHDP